LNQCHNAANKFGSVTQHVGQGMFGRDIHIRTYTGTDCTGDSRQVDLTNSDSCDLEAGNAHWASFELRRRWALKSVQLVKRGFWEV
jgi:hypothetical protein